MYSILLAKTNQSESYNFFTYKTLSKKVAFVTAPTYHSAY